MSNKQEIWFCITIKVIQKDPRVSFLLTNIFYVFLYVILAKVFWEMSFHILMTRM